MGVEEGRGGEAERGEGEWRGVEGEREGGAWKRRAWRNAWRESVDEERRRPDHFRYKYNRFPADSPLLESVDETEDGALLQIPGNVPDGRIDGRLGSLDIRVARRRRSRCSLFVKALRHTV